MKKMYLSKDKKVFGVCGGIAEYFDVDPSIIRIAWVIATVLTGFLPGVIAYVIVAVIVPEHEKSEIEGEVVHTSNSKTAHQH